MVTTMVAAASLVAVVLTQGIVAYFLIRHESDAVPRKKVIRNRV